MKRDRIEDIAELFDGVATVERQHEEAYKRLAQKVKTDTMFKAIILQLK